ncbi:hypothetical protein [Mesorhizobium sp. M2C.T.Ca.TU.002.02.1.1]|uniref:Uncharacterized protein n=1 Tax=Mesorhizobium plurifarium TaxID=69974 RepID=A0A0K2W568_MESPL|nr:hypothetical protein [Mesorhizobium sp. M2C.T.Ca.TU.002.02.1.1]RUU61426.1 hypothetical protein EOD07_01135 [Mesorhizobium sp. M2C.T.Ca.TU.002.02.1.1]RUU67061.1 hypothetical protein EOD04_16660 [Mesorhizobium sp. M2C.T.Ca.TU.009.01.2.1]CDX61310.1 conserved hypothetical protein [Mesorhizobium plurifarium]
MHFASFRMAPRLGQNIPTEYFILANLKNDGAVIGRLADHLIRETVVDGHGSSYRYVGVATRGPDGRYDVEALRPGEWIVQPGLVYALETKG